MNENNKDLVLKIEDLHQPWKIKFENNENLNEENSDDTKHEFGIVLSGGGAKGAYQIGAMKALMEFGIRPLGYSGSSIGSLNEALLKTNNLETCEKIWKDLKISDIFEINEEDILLGLSNKEGLIELIDEYINLEIIRDSMLPMYVTICTDEATKQGKYIKLNGKSVEEIKTLLLASSALPVIFEKEFYDNKLCSDGGIFDNNPIFPLFEEGIEKIIIISNSHLYEQKQYYPGTEVIVIKPTIDLKGLFAGTLNFNKEELSMRLKLGYSDAKRVLNDYFGIENEHSELYDNGIIMQEYKMDKLQTDVDYYKNIINKYDDIF